MINSLLLPNEVSVVRGVQLQGKFYQNSTSKPFQTFPKVSWLTVNNLGIIADTCSMLIGDLNTLQSTRSG